MMDADIDDILCEQEKVFRSTHQHPQQFLNLRIIIVLLAYLALQGLCLRAKGEPEQGGGVRLLLSDVASKQFVERLELISEALEFPAVPAHVELQTRLKFVANAL